MSLPVVGFSKHGCSPFRLKSKTYIVLSFMTDNIHLTTEVVPTNDTTEVVHLFKTLLIYAIISGL